MMCLFILVDNILVWWLVWCWCTLLDEDGVYICCQLLIQSVGGRESAVVAAAGEGIIAMRTMNKDKEEMINVVKVGSHF